MTYVQLYIPLEISRETVCLLGNLGNIMFRDLNKDLTDFQRSYVSQLRKFDDVERLLNYLKETADKHSDATWKYILHVDEQGNDIISPSLTTVVQSLGSYSQDSINNLIGDVTGSETRVRQLDDSLNGLKEKLNGLIENRCVIIQCSKYLERNPNTIGRSTSDSNSTANANENDFIFSDEEVDAVSNTLSDTFSFDDDDNNNNDTNNDNNSGQAPMNARLTTDETTSFEEFGFLETGYHHRYMIAGSINRTKVELLNRILWRLLRGNLFFQNFPIDIPLLEGKEKVEKDSFIVFTHGDLLLSKVKRVIESLDGKVVTLERRPHDAVEKLNSEISDIQQVVHTTEQTLHTELLVVNDQLPTWNAVVKREKYIHATLNLFKQEVQGLLAEGWIPSSDVDELSDSLKDHSESLGSEYGTVVNIIHTNKNPPTFHRTNKFTQAFQSIVDAYATATYKEVNPGLATIVTFPFMFAIMFGDAGHGMIVLLIALYFILNEKKFEAMQKDEILDMVYSGRYMICLMGAFSIYTGIIYNDIFSRPMTFFKSGWEWPSTFKKGDSIEAGKVGVYSFGIDYAWHGAENGLLFMNSYKMKLSILMGFIHMTYSYAFAYINFRYKNSRVDIIGNFIPGLIFMQSIFGYLSWAIVYKWSKDWIKDGKPAPGLLNMLINMFLSPGTIDEPLYRGQAVLQSILLIAALVCVPWLLLYKPLTLRKQNKGYRRLQSSNADNPPMLNIEIQDPTLDSSNINNSNMTITDYGDDTIADDDNEEEEAFDFGDVMIHQVIHTIEFCLNCISHTASYLRLWALSLAHAQLSSVLWDMTIGISFSSNNSGSTLSVIKVIFLFGMWFVLSVCILVFMEGTSAMLHALRLHWVEAMSKFFEGEGYPYEPFSFDNLIE
ncbi:H(+)-transporting V0 sector ATPase subunit a NDAI_0G04680 [Naumovozyma dairenensis CBS 421]|uniref:V-type proton ATPase subunit a n=1 Tax=Naumovozyma dairenensis (strain ATCC 10597 / BCRC 20456 / CBS 421 / NBRC 0211 / NRRL Y-12639) TaxID=1071378 RepID=J7SB08_NAUDC|nr:hypothetical protein NDAI_0G04680 [Naumovozyma dairenensis CBS 421]CCK73453.1 hypothetical protein NDAI_0G04680 [Naumovozyma dairenensis CBS 421]